MTTAVLCPAPPEAAAAELVRQAVLGAVRRAPAPAFARMRRAEREAVALGRIAGCPVAEVAAALGVGDGAARRLLTAGLRSMLRRRERAGGERRRLRSVAEAQLLEDIAHVGLDRRLAQEQPLGDLAVAQALGHEPEDLALAGARMASGSTT